MICVHLCIWLRCPVKDKESCIISSPKYKSKLLKSKTAIKIYSFKNNIHHVTKHIAIFRYGKLDICMCNFLLFIRCYFVFLQTIVLRKLYPICIICISMLYLHLFIDNELRYRVLLLMSRETHIGHGGHVLSAIDESEIRFLNFKLLQYCKFIKQDVKFSWNQFHTHWLVKFWSVQELSIMAITIVTWYVVHQRKSHGLNSQSRENNLFF